MPSKKSCIQQGIKPLKKAEGVRPASPSPASSALSLAAPPVPRPHAASRSSTRPAAHSACSSWGCPSSDQQCEPSDANKERGKKKKNPVSHLVVTFWRKSGSFIFFGFKPKCPVWCSPASAPPGRGPAASAPSGQSEPPPLSASPQSAPLGDEPRWCHLVATSSSEEAA